MSYSVMFALLLLTPLLFSLLCFACRKRGLSATCTVTVLHSLGITLLLILALWVVQTAADAGEIFAAGLWLHIDGLGGLFLAILGVIGFLTGVYSIGYMRHEVAHGELSPVTLCDYYGFFHLFLFTMLLVVTSNNLIVMWAAIEATTLSSAFLVGVSGRHLRSAFIAGISMEVHHYLYCWCRFWSVRYRAGIRQRRQRYAAGRNGDILERGS